MKIPANKRSIEFRANPIETTEDEEKNYIVEGKAVSFNSPTVLFEEDGIEYREQIDAHAFDEANMDDVIFNYDHQGKVMARTRNKTLGLDVKEDGLYIRADLSGTEEGRKLYEEIQGGYIDRMSFQFTIAEETYDKEERMWTVNKVKRLYDVSAVSIPAYDDTLIEARKALVQEADAKRKKAEAMRSRLATLKNTISNI